MFYILTKNKKVRKVKDVIVWGQFLKEGEKRRVGLDYVSFGKRNQHTIQISTVFLGLDYSFGFEKGAKPVVFETMTFSEFKKIEQVQERYCTYEEALAGHKKVVAKIKRQVKAYEKGN